MNTLSNLKKSCQMKRKQVSKCYMKRTTLCPLYVSKVLCFVFLLLQLNPPPVAAKGKPSQKSRLYLSSYFHPSLLDVRKSRNLLQRYYIDTPLPRRSRRIPDDYNFSSILNYKDTSQKLNRTTVFNTSRQYLFPVSNVHNNRQKHMDFTQNSDLLTSDPEGTRWNNRGMQRQRVPETLVTKYNSGKSHLYQTPHPGIISYPQLYRSVHRHSSICCQDASLLQVRHKSKIGSGLHRNNGLCTYCYDHVSHAPATLEGRVQKRNMGSFDGPASHRRRFRLRQSPRRWAFNSGSSRTWNNKSGTNNTGPVGNLQQPNDARMMLQGDFNRTDDFPAAVSDIENETHISLSSECLSGDLSACLTNEREVVNASDITEYPLRTSFQNNSSEGYTPSCYYYPGNSSLPKSYHCDPELMSNLSRSSGSTVSSLLASEWTRIVAFSLIFVVGVVGNVLVVVTLLHHKNLRTVTNVFLLNLAVSDLLLGVFCMPFTLVGSLLQDFVFGSLVCRLIPYMQAVSVSVSVWTLVAISLERFYAICQPLRSRRWQTPSHSYRVIAVVWAVSLAFMMPIAVLSTLMPVKRDPGRHKCREVWPSLSIERAYTILLTTTLLLVPLVVMAAAYIRVVRTLWLGVRAQTSSNNSDITPTVRVSTVENLSTNHTRSLSKKSFASQTRISIRFRKVPAITARGTVTDGQKKDGSSSHEPCDTSGISTPGHQPPPEAVESEGMVSRSMRRKWWRARDANSTSSAECQTWRSLRSSQTERSLIAKRRVVRMLFVLVAEFFICWSPLFIVNLLSLYIPRQVYAALGSVGVSLVQLLAYISSCCNPITYCFMNAKFLQSFKQTFGCAHKRTHSFHSTNVNSFRRSVSYNQVPLNVMLDRNATQKRSQRQQLVHHTQT